MSPLTRLIKLPIKSFANGIWVVADLLGLGNSERHGHNVVAWHEEHSDIISMSVFDRMRCGMSASSRLSPLFHGQVYSSMFCELELTETSQQNIISFGQLREERAREREKRNGEVGAKTHNTRSIGPNLAFPLLKLLPRFIIFFTLNFAGLP
jgi:hypothetical protein